jgi:D-lactate dehydrogenase
MKILYVRPYQGEAEVVTDVLAGHEVLYADTLSLVSDDVAKQIDILSVFVDTVVDVNELDRFSSLKSIATRSAGFDHIAVKEAQARGIVVCRVPHYGSQTVAEFAFALMFALSRNAYQAYIDMLDNPSATNLGVYEGFDLGGKTLGVVGTGKIGVRVCAIAKSFGMHVIAYDQFENEEVHALNIPYADLATVLQTADIVTLHVPGRPETHHLINSEAIALMKPTAYLINTARGEVVDTEALVQALREKKIAGAGLDVLEREHELASEQNLDAAQKEDAVLKQTLAYNHELIAMPNVVVTPHIAFNTKEAKAEITEITLSNIKAFVEGTATNVVTI